MHTLCTGNSPSDDDPTIKNMINYASQGGDNVRVYRRQFKGGYYAFLAYEASLLNGLSALAQYQIYNATSNWVNPTKAIKGPKSYTPINHDGEIWIDTTPGSLTPAFIEHIANGTSDNDGNVSLFHEIDPPSGRPRTFAFSA